MTSFLVFSQRAWICVPFGATCNCADVWFLQIKRCYYGATSELRYWSLQRTAVIFPTCTQCTHLIQGHLLFPAGTSTSVCELTLTGWTEWLIGDNEACCLETSK